MQIVSFESKNQQLSHHVYQLVNRTYCLMLTCFSLLSGGTEGLISIFDTAVEFNKRGYTATPIENTGG